MTADGPGTEAAYQRLLQEAAAAHGDFLVLFHAPWCPDCQRVQPAVQSVARQHGLALLEWQVGPKEAWRAPDCWLRTSPATALTCIPTLLSFSGGGTAGPARLDSALEKSKSREEAQRLVEGFLRKGLGPGAANCCECCGLVLLRGCCPRTHQKQSQS